MKVQTHPDVAQGDFVSRSRPRSSSSPADASHPRKRGRIQVQEPTEDVEMAAIGHSDSPLMMTAAAAFATSSSSTTQQEHSFDDPPPPPPPPAPARLVILETAKETCLLLPSVLIIKARVVRVYDSALLLETEVVVEDQEPGVAVENVDEKPAVDVETKVVVDEEAPSSSMKDALIATTKDGSAPSKSTVFSIADGASEPKPKSGLSSSLIPLPSSSH